MSRERLEKNRRLITGNHFALHNHVVVTELEENTAEGYLDVEEDVTNAYGMIHGGAFYALADVIAGMTARGNGHAYVTQTADLHYLSTTEEKRIYGRSRVIRRGRATAIIEAKVTDSAGKELFLAIFTFYCVDGRVSVRG
ncbi:MAG: PaaI family thioesterase [Stomatobaculum sp.]